MWDIYTLKSTINKGNKKEMILKCKYQELFSLQGHYISTYDFL